MAAMDEGFAGALEAVRLACDALRAGDPLKQKMKAFVETVVDADDRRAWSVTRIPWCVHTQKPDAAAAGVA